MPIIPKLKHPQTTAAPTSLGLHPKSGALATMIEKEIADHPVPLDGHLWASKPQEDWATLLGVSIATLRRIISEPPFVRERTWNDEQCVVTLLRTGEPGPKSPRHLANIMAKIFREQTKRSPSDHAFGCLVGCAEVWPDGHQLKIFKLVLKEWDVFMVAFRLALDTGLLTPPSPPKTYAKPVQYLKWQHPHLPTLRLGASVALEFYQMRQQEKGEAGAS